MPLFTINKPLQLIANFDLSAGGTTTCEALNLPEYSMIFVQFDNVLGNAGSATGNLNFSSNNGSTYPVVKEIVPAISGNKVNGFCLCSLMPGSIFMFTNLQRGSSSPFTSNTQVIQTNTELTVYPNAMKITFSSPCQASAGAAIKFMGMLKA